MEFSIHVKRLIFGQHFYSGFFAACGVIGLGLLWHLWLELPIALALSSGALCVSLVDLPSPLRHKAVDVSAAALAGAGVTLLVAVSRDMPMSLGAVILLVGFGAAMLTAFGRRAMPLSFSLLLAMVLAIGVVGGKDLSAGQHAQLFLAGGAAYALFALLVARINRLRTKRQALAESLFELAEFARATAQLFNTDSQSPQHRSGLIMQQATLTERQQLARDVLFTDVRGAEAERLANLLKYSIDLYEHLLAVQSERERVMAYFAHGDALPLLHDLIQKMALDLEQTAHAILRHRTVKSRVSYLAESFALAHEQVRVPPQAGEDSALARCSLDALVHDLRQASERIVALRALANHETQADTRWLENGVATRFVSPSSYRLRALRDQLDPDSPVLRHALRSTLALACGALVAYFLPYGTHSYWILLTIAVIMRSSFSAMRQRYGDRVMGNLIGCLIAALILYLAPPAPVTLLILFGCVTLAHTFVTLNYRTTSIAVCVLALLQLNTIDPAGFLIVERLLDTLIGAVIAYGFSFLLPSWEAKRLGHQTRALLQACDDFAVSVMSDERADEDAYRLARKRLFDALATLSNAARDMQREPVRQQRGGTVLQELIWSSYLLASQLATLHLQLQFHAPDARAQSPLLPSLAFALDQVRHHLGAALSITHGTTTPHPAPPADQPPGSPAATADTGELVQARQHPSAGSRLIQGLLQLEHAAAALFADTQRLMVAIEAKD